MIFELSWNGRASDRATGGVARVILIPTREARQTLSGRRMMYESRSGVPKEKDVRKSAISLRRRYLMIAGLAGAAAPTVSFAGATTSPLGAPAVSSFADRLVVSGRILGTDGKPLSGATVEIWPAGSRQPRGEASTDADGRFFAAVPPAGHRRPQDLRYRVVHGGRGMPVQRLHFARGEMQRDEAGAWRATFAATLA